MEGAHYGPGKGTVFLDDVMCEGTETSIMDCPHSGIRFRDCDHDEDAGVKCGRYFGSLELLLS